MTIDSITKNLIEVDRLLIIQDLDGVCIPLVKDPLTRIIDKSYVEAAYELKEEFRVLTNGEHEGYRGVNRLIEKAFNSDTKFLDYCGYLPGLAAGGVQYQNRNGKVKAEGVTEEEKDFLKRLPQRIKSLIFKEISSILPELTYEQYRKQTHLAVIDTELSPTINLNYLFELIPNDIEKQRKLQQIALQVMNKLLDDSVNTGLSDSFFLHIAPNLGINGEKELIKLADKSDIGTTDIQFMIKGATKEKGLLVLLNKYIKEKRNYFPFGRDFNARQAPNSLQELNKFVKDKISHDDMPILVGVGDTVTSSEIEKGVWSRGGSDRGFLTLIQEIGKSFQKKNQVFIVDSSSGEVDRPNLSKGVLEGVSDPYDNLKFNHIFTLGPSEYIKWFKKLSKKRAIRKNAN